MVSQVSEARVLYVQRLAEVQAHYLHRQVWFEMRRGIKCEGEVVAVDGCGRLHVLYGYDELSQPLYHVVLFRDCFTCAE